MANVDETGDGDQSNGRAPSDEFAAQLAAVIFEWRPARISTVPQAASELWMSRSARRSIPTSG